MVFKFESRAEATALLRRRSRDAAVALLNKEFTAQRWTLRKELKLSVRPLVTLRYFRRAVGAVRAPAPGARELCAGGAVVVVAYAVALVARGAVGGARARRARIARVGRGELLFVVVRLRRALHRGPGHGHADGRAVPVPPLRAPRHGLAPPRARVRDGARPRGPVARAGRGRGNPRGRRREPGRERGAGGPRGARGFFVPGRLEARRRRRFPGRRARGEADAARDAASFRARSRDGRAALALRAAVPGFFSGAGSAVGELVPFFLARAARRAGADPFAVIEEEEAAADDEAPARRPRLPLLAARTRARLEAALADGAFWKIFVLAALPNPFFDLCGLVCGSLDVSLGTYFGACFAAKALVRTPLQTCAVALAVHRVGGAPAPPRALARVARGAFLALSSLLFACFLVSALEQMAQQRAIAELRADYDSILLAGEDA